MASTGADNSPGSVSGSRGNGSGGRSSGGRSPNAGGNQAGNNRVTNQMPTPQVTPVGPAADSGFSVSQSLIDAITKFSGGLLGETEPGRSSELSQILAQAQNTQGLSNQFLDIGSGKTADPRFAGIRDRTLQEQGNQLSRRGLGGSSAAFNQLGRVQSDLNFQELSSRDRALGLGAQLGSQSSGLFSDVISGDTARREGFLNRQTTGIETLALIDQLKIAGLAAENAGKMPDEEKDKNSFNPFDKDFDWNPFD